MNPRQLEYVVAAVEEGTFTAAAERCHVAQPSLSASVAQLERELGTLLFHRIGRSIRPTPTCERLLPLAREALRSLDAASAAVSAPTGDVSGLVELAVQPTLVVHPTIGLIAGVRGTHPDVTVRLLAPADDESVSQMVESGRGGPPARRRARRPPSDLAADRDGGVRGRVPPGRQAEARPCRRAARRSRRRCATTGHADAHRARRSVRGRRRRATSRGRSRSPRGVDPARPRRCGRRAAARVEPARSTPPGRHRDRGRRAPPLGRADPS